MSRIFIALAAWAVSSSSLAVAGGIDLPQLDPRAPSPSPQIETGLESYHLFTDEPLQDWQAANRQVFEAAVEMGLPGTYANRPGTGHAGHGMHGDQQGLEK